jgi:hypothetical protein
LPELAPGCAPVIDAGLAFLVDLADGTFVVECLTDADSRSSQDNG